MCVGRVTVCDIDGRVMIYGVEYREWWHMILIVDQGKDVCMLVK